MNVSRKKLTIAIILASILAPLTSGQIIGSNEASIPESASSLKDVVVNEKYTAIGGLDSSDSNTGFVYKTGEWGSREAKLTEPANGPFAFDIDSKYLAYGGNFGGSFWVYEKGNWRSPIHGDSYMDSIKDEPRGMALSSTAGAVAISQRESGNVAVFEYENWDNKLATLTEASSTTWSVDFSPEGDELAVPSYDGNLRIYYTSNYSVRKAFQDGSSYYRTAKYTPSGNYLLFHSSDTIYIMNTSNYEVERKIEGFENDVRGLDASRDGWLAVAINGASTNSLELYDIESKDLIDSLDTSSASFVDVSVYNKTLALLDGENDKTEIYSLNSYSSNQEPSITNTEPSETNLEPSSTELSITVEDKNSDLMNITFYNNADDSEIGTVENVRNGTHSVTWTGLSEDQTYNWYAEVTDGTSTATSTKTSFTTIGITLNWNDNSGNEEGFRIYSNASGTLQEVATTSANSQSTTVYNQGLEFNKNTTYEVAAYNQYGESNEIKGYVKP